ncbi:PAP2 family lipid A phosphatase [Psychrobacter urativorans]|uniref:PAP2 family lipid A phosphatase n=1 Tax=Psychrobacter urativorans TaxID=45610 RepID=UPI00191A2B13|nr:PAP2 family lipid A phosphatase [Psychrobacter urativorans]
MILKVNSTDWLWLKLLGLTIIATLTLEHSQLDIDISQLFYSNGHWLLAKGQQPYLFIFYDFPKASLILFGVYLLLSLLYSYWRNRRPSAYADPNNARSLPSKIFTWLPRREISYLLLVIILVPSIIGTLKGVTHVSCPNNLTLFNGDLAYLNIWQNILAKTPAKCFPAAHASAGFALYGLAYLPSLQRYRSKILITVTILGWSMGLYKMSIGDHFFSHTLVSMLLSWTLVCALAVGFFKTSFNQLVNMTNSQLTKSQAKR